MNRLAGLILFVSIVLTTMSYGQVKGFSPIETEKLLQEDFTSQLNSQNIIEQNQMPLGDIIVPEYYRIGPGDVLAVQNLTTSVKTQYLNVTPEISVLIPRVGSVDLKGMTLDNAIKAIQDAFKERNDKAIVYVSLYKPRKVIVALRGNIDVKGTFVLPASYRVSTAIAMLNQPKRDQVTSQMAGFITNKQLAQKYSEKQYNKSGIPVPLPYSSRNVFVLHNDGTGSVVDMEEASVTGNIKLDPYVMENDIITVPVEPVDYPEISISGEVIRPVRLPYKETDDVAKLLKFGYGFTDDADLNNITLNYNDGTSQKITLNDKFELENVDYPIKPGTSIIVPQKKPDYQKSRIVSVQGCVNHPGSYLLSGDSVRLSDVIEKAGGFTDKAYLPLAYILRSNKEFGNKEFTRWNFAENFQYSDLKLEDTTRYNIDINFKKPVVSCDFVAAFINGKDDADILMHDGDIVVVPTNPKTVYVFGQVNNPGYVTFQPDKTMEWYIEKVGGYAINAEDSRARIIDGRTKVWRESGENVFVHAGDEIYVPKPPDYPPSMKLQTWAIAATAVTALASLINIFLIIFRQ